MSLGRRLGDEPRTVTLLEELVVGASRDERLMGIATVGHTCLLLLREMKSDVLRFYDLRHTHATLLRKARVDLGAVQRALGHSSPEITAAIYDHSELEDYRADVERALSFAHLLPVNAPVMQGPENRQERRPRSRRESRSTAGPSDGRGDWI